MNLLISNKSFSIWENALRSLAFLLCFLHSPNQAFSQTVTTFSFSGITQTFVVPSCVSTISMTLRGAQGASNNLPGGTGGQVYGVLTVTPGQVLYINVGGQGSGATGGFNGGGNGGAAGQGIGRGGGGASDVRNGGQALSNRIIVAAGGGGSNGHNSFNILTGGAGGGGSACTTPSLGMGGAGSGGGSSGISGACVGGTTTSFGAGGGGGGLNSPGGPSGSGNGGFGQAGSLGQGGHGGDAAATYGGSSGGQIGGGGGGGGLYGGSGGMCVGVSSGGGGGGSSYCDASVFTNISFSTSLSYTGNGIASFTYNTISPVLLPVTTYSLCSGQTLTISANSQQSYTWSNSSSGSSIAVSPTNNTVYSVSATNTLGCVSSASALVSVSNSVPSLSTSSSASQICMGQTVGLTASGATSYTWQTPIGNSYTPAIVVSPSQSGTLLYTVIANNGYCNTSATLTVLSLSVPLVSIAATNTVICSGQTTTLTASGASAYSWSPSGTSLAVISVSPASTIHYSVTGTNGSGCSTTATTQVVVNPNPTLIVTASHTMICKGQQTTLSVNGAHTYSWNGSATGPVYTVAPTQSSIYSVTGTYTNNGCSASRTLQVIVFHPTVSITGTNQICNGVQTVLQANSSSPASYTWNTGSNLMSVLVNPSITSIYWVSITSASNSLICYHSATHTVNVLPNPTVSAAAVPSVICRNENAWLVASGADSYSWMPGSLSGSTVTVTHTINGTFHYTVTGTDLNGCSQTQTLMVKVSPCVGVLEHDLKDSESYEVMPVPAFKTLNILTRQASVYRITDMDGKVWQSGRTEAGQVYHAEVDQLPAGIYLFVLNTDSGLMVKKIIIGEK